MNPERKVSVSSKASSSVLRTDSAPSLRPLNPAPGNAASSSPKANDASSQGSSFWNTVCQQCRGAKSEDEAVTLSPENGDQRPRTGTRISVNRAGTGDQVGEEELDRSVSQEFDAKRDSVGNFMVVHKAGKAFRKGVQNSDKPSMEDHDRGVHVETVYDYYDPVSRKIRIRKMDETVVHRRRGSMRNLYSLSENNVNAAAALAAVAAACDKKDKKDDDERSEGSDCGSEGSGKSVVSTGSQSSQFSSSSFKSTASQREKDLKKQALNKLRRQKSVVDTEATANWGLIVGKVLHRKVLDFSVVKDKAIRKRRFQAEEKPASPDGTDSGSPIWLSRLQERAKAIWAQAWELAKKAAKEPVDTMDHEWEDENLLTHLFSTEYLDTLMLLANAACKLLASQPPLVAASTPCRVFGDLHGQLRDLLLFFHAYGMPGKDGTTFVFNGDFVDRGRHQLELVGLLLALKVMLPDKVWLIRGNHEDRLMNEKYGFKSECLRLLGADFGRKMFGLMQSAFDRLPIACLVGNRILVVHGGIGDGKWGLSDLWNISRPLTSEKILAKENSWIFNILWSDPIEDGKSADPNTFGVHSSPRGGVTAQFAWNVTKTFCARNGLGLIIRSHQSKKGSRGFDVMHSNMLVRVFSARDYEGHGNDSAVLLITRKKADPKDPSSSGPEGENDLLVVRPQVLRSVMKQRAEAAKHWRAERGVPSPGTASRRRRTSADLARRGERRRATMQKEGVNGQDSDGIYESQGSNGSSGSNGSNGSDRSDDSFRPPPRRA